MKLLLVDDEQPVRSSIRLLGRFKELGIGQVFEASSYAQALACCRLHKPEIVLTDIRMPDHDGLELMEWLHSNLPQTVIIVISAYQDFDYALSAIRNGALDYLLKPVHPAKLHAVLTKAISKIEKKEESPSYELLTLDMNERTMISLFIEGDAPLPDHTRLHQLFAAPLGFVICDLYLIHSAGKGTISNMKELCGFIREDLKKENAGWIFQGIRDPGLVYLLLTGDYTAQKAYFEQLCEKIKESNGIQFMYEARYNGVWKESILPDLAAKTTEVLCSQPIWNCYNGIPSRIPQKTEDFFRQIESAEYENCREQIREWCDEIKRFGQLTRNDLHAWWDRIAESFEQAAAAEEIENPSASFCFPQVMLPVLSFQLRFSAEALMDLLLELVDMLSPGLSASATTERLARKIEKEIQDHYAEPISLSGIAEKFHRNASHVARIFKDQYDQSISTCITEVRMTHAMKLLDSSDQKISRIAHLVGYDDEKYFCRVFKKSTGLSPADYRKKARAGKNES